MGNIEESGIEIDGLDEIEVENTAVDDLDSENINLIFLGIDESGTMHIYKKMGLWKSVYQNLNLG